MRLNRFSLFILCIIAGSCPAAEWLWTGAVGSNWSNKANWSTTSPNPVPGPGDTLRLAGGVFKPANQDIPNLAVQAIVLPAGAAADTVVSGSSLTLGAGGLSVEAASTDFRFNTPLVLSEMQTWQIAAGRTVFLGGTLTGEFASFGAQGTSNTSNAELTGVDPIAGIVRGLPVSGAHIHSTWVHSISGSTVTLTRPGLTNLSSQVTFTACWIVRGGGTLDAAAANGDGLNVPLLVRSGAVRFSPLTQLKRGALLDRTAVLELRAGSGAMTLSAPVVSLAGLSAFHTEPESPALLVHDGDALILPAPAGQALHTQTGGGTENVFRMPGAGSVTFQTPGAPPLRASASLRLESGSTTVRSLALQPVTNPGIASGSIEFLGDATLTIQANSAIATTDATGRVTPALEFATDFNLCYGPRQFSVLSGNATLFIASGALFQNNLAPFNDYVLVAPDAALTVHGADDTALFRLGRSSSADAQVPAGNTGRFELIGGQFYIHAHPAAPPQAIFPRQPGFTLALNGGVFNGNRVGDFEGHLVLRDAPASLPRVDNLKLAGSGNIFWGAGDVEKMNVADHPNGHDSSQGLHRLHFSASGGSVHVETGARLRIAAGTVTADAADPFTDTTDGTRHVSIENNATLLIENTEKRIGDLSGYVTDARLQLDARLTVNSSGDTSYAGRLAGNSSFVKAGGGTLRLSGNNSSYAGALTVREGTLVAEHATAATGTQSVTIQSGGTLAGHGRVPGGAVVSGELRPGQFPFAPGDNTLETGALMLQSTSVLRIHASGSPAESASVTVSGNLTLNGGTVLIEDGGGLSAGDVVLLRYSGSMTGNISALSLLQVPPGFSGQLLHDSAQKTILLRLSAPPVSSIASPQALTYRAATWPALISGSTQDTNGVGLSTLDVSIREAASALYFDGSNFASTSEVWLPALLNGTQWSLAFPLTHFAADGAYSLRVRATDSAQNVENPPAVRAFSLDRVAPTVTVHSLATQSAAPALSGTVNDPAASVVVTVQGHSAGALNLGGTWLLAANTLPGLQAGTYDVVVRATDAAGNVGTDASLNELTISLPDIALTASSPKSGSAAGGTAVTISGAHLDLVTAVRFGNAAATIQSKSAAAVVVLAPEHPAGTVSLHVESLSNTATLANAFTFINPPPSLSSVAPSRVCTDGSSLITILGSGFQPGVDVQVRGRSATNVIRESGQKLLARAPANAPGFAAVTVVNPDRNAVSLPNALTYDQPPQLTSVPHINVAQLQANAPAQLLFGWIDPEGSAVNYSIDWGDGSPPGTNTQHAYSNPGTYTITLSASDGVGTSIHTLVVAVGAGGAAPDPAPPGTALTIDSFTAGARFDVSGKDTLQIKAHFPALPAGVSFAGSRCTIDAGGASATFELDAKGKGRSAAGTLTLRGKFTRDRATRATFFSGGAPVLQFRLKGAYAAAWIDEGVAAEGPSGATVPFAIRVTLAERDAAATVHALSKVRIGKLGKYTFRR